MLVLRRKAGEALVINGAVTVTVLAVEGERVKLGVIAPEQVVVLRGELIDAEAQRAHLRRKREALAREMDSQTREKLARSLARWSNRCACCSQPLHRKAARRERKPGHERTHAGIDYHV